MIISRHFKEWEYVIGLEIHAQLNTNSKMFSSSVNKPGEIPNYNVSVIDASIPGTLPSLNKKCLELSIRAGLGLNCTINKFSEFDRKHYFYPDLPNGYQITQFYHPIATKGYIIIDNQKIRINRIHMENDAGKSIHEKNFSLIDLNRAGVGLIEIVTEPDITTPALAAKTVKEIRNILKSLDVCVGDLEKGTLRCDANVSVRLAKSAKLGNRCEIKNVNSYQNIEKAIIYEANRQIDLIVKGEKIRQSTMLFNDATGETSVMREKENLDDYRYFREPDLPSIVIDQNYINQIEQDMPEVLSDKVNRYMTQYKLTEYESQIIASNKYTSKYFEDIAAEFNNYSLISSWMIGELFSLLNKYQIEFKNNTISSHNFLELLEMIDSQKISGKIGKSVLKYMYEEKKSPNLIVQEKKLEQITDQKILTSIISEVVEENKKIVFDFQSGKQKAFVSLIGLIMKKSQGKANPQLVNEILLKLIS